MLFSNIMFNLCMLSASTQGLLRRSGSFSLISCGCGVADLSVTVNGLCELRYDSGPTFL